MATDLNAQLLSWVLDEIGRQQFGQEYAAAVTFVPAPVQLPGGLRLVPSWQLLVTAPNPLLGEGRLWHLVPLPGPSPEEEAVRELVTDGLRQLRDLRASKLSEGNGHVPAALGKGRR